MKSIQKTRNPRCPLLVKRAEQQVAEEIGYSVRDLHSVWREGKNGNTEADKTIRGILDEYPKAWVLMNAFIRHAKRATTEVKNNHGSLIYSIQEEKRKKRDSIWTSPKAKWVSVSSGGLPSLGKRK